MRFSKKIPVEYAIGSNWLVFERFWVRISTGTPVILG
jgi:hypothetical protein